MPKASKVNTPTPSPRKPQTRRQQAPAEPVDKSTWRVSEIPEDVMINKTAALQEYRLSQADLEGVKFERTTKTIAGVERPMFLYSEREVEYRAWVKYGGPEALDEFINEKKQKFYTQHGANTDKEFKQPKFYKRYDAPRELRDVKAELVDAGNEWLWKALADNLRGPDHWHVSLEDYIPHIFAAQRILFIEYPPRPVPDPRMYNSASFSALDGVLSWAPVWKADQEDKLTPEEKAQFSISDDGYPNYDQVVKWSTPYLTEIYSALRTVIIEHGTPGWECARWMIYDKHVECNLGSVEHGMDRGDHLWGDKGTMWLHADRYEGMSESEKAAFLESLKVNTTSTSVGHCS